MTIKYRQGPQGSKSALDITAPTTLFVGQGMCFNVSVLVTPTAAGGIYDAASTSDAAQTNQMAPISTTASGIIPMAGAWVFNGLTIDPGTDGAVSVWFQPGI